MNKISTTNALVLILLLALALRLPNINANFSGDEVDTAGPARHFLVDGDFRQFNDCNGTAYYNFSHPPVRLLLYSAWSSVFGFSNIALRSLSTIFGIAAIVVIYLIGKEIYSKKAGLIAAFLAAVSNYHIYGSNLVSTDTGHFMFTTSITVLFFIMYLKRNNNRYFAASLAFAAISMLTKFSTLIIFIPIVAGLFLYKGKKAGTIIGTYFIAMTVVLTGLILSTLSVLLGNSDVFWGPIRGFTTYAPAVAMLQTFSDKVFKLATITWQMTPFFALLALLLVISICRAALDIWQPKHNKTKSVHTALFRIVDFLKRTPVQKAANAHVEYTKNETKDSLILVAWLVLGLLVAIAPSGQDAQRFFLMMLAPAFVIAGKYLETIKVNIKSTITLIAGFIVVAALLNLNYLMGYYQPFYLGIFYLAAIAALFFGKYRNTILIAGFIGLSLFFAFSGNVIQLYSNAVSETGQTAINAGYPPNLVWTSKDVSYYMTPINETVKNCELSALTPQFARQNNITYLAFYSSVPRQNEINTMEGYCSHSKEVAIDGYRLGLVCKIDQTKLQTAS